MLPQRIEYIAWQQASVQYAVLRKMTQPFGSNLPGMLSSFAAVQAMRTDSRARFAYIEKKTTHACSVYTVYSHTIYTRTHTYIHTSIHAGRQACINTYIHAVHVCTSHVRFSTQCTPGTNLSQSGNLKALPHEINLLAWSMTKGCVQIMVTANNTEQHRAKSFASPSLRPALQCLGGKHILIVKFQAW